MPRAWLADPARVYLAKIDPNIGDSATKDTYLSQGLPTQSFGTQADLFCGRMSSSAAKCRTLVRSTQVSTAIGAARHIGVGGDGRSTFTSTGNITSEAARTAAATTRAA